MVRVSVLIAITFLAYGTGARPHSSWAKVGEEQYQETLKSEEPSGKMSAGLKEVEPPEDMAVTDDDIDPDMRIWKAAQWAKGRKHLAPEDDRDDLYHPSVGHAPEARAHAGPQELSFRSDPAVRPYQQAEPDLDHAFHGFPGSVAREALEDPGQPHRRYNPGQPQEGRGRVDYSQPEDDRDEVYHGDAPAQRLYLQAQIQPKPLSHMTYSQPEEGRDHLYHD